MLGPVPASAGDSAFVEVGEVPASCPITIEARAGFQMPPGWKVTPQQAVTAAAEFAHAKCNDIFLQVLYADADNYYLAKPAFGPMSRAAKAIVVNAISGKVSLQNEGGT